MSYSRLEVEENLYEIMGANGERIKTHQNMGFPLLSENLSANLIDDLNNINELNSSGTGSELNANERREELFVASVSGDELKESLAYCVISTMVSAEGRQFEVNLEQLIQWDRAFRLNPGPPLLLTELNVLTKAKSVLESDWPNLPLNYSDSIESMQESGVEFVPEDITRELRGIVDAMQPAQRFMIHLLYQYFEGFSITLIILFVAGKIMEDQLVNAFWVFHYQMDAEDSGDEEFKKSRFMMNRLLFMKMILWGYNWGDSSLQDFRFPEADDLG